jgi:hypothetical protein
MELPASFFCVEDNTLLVCVEFVLMQLFAKKKVIPKCHDHRILSEVVSFPQVSPPKPCVHLSSPLVPATCSTHLILLDFITRTKFG